MTPVQYLGTVKAWQLTCVRCGHSRKYYGERETFPRRCSGCKAQYWYMHADDVPRGNAAWWAAQKEKA